MKLFISVDMEGITDVTGWSEVEFDQKGYAQACRQMSLETAAACEAAVGAGYEVVVRDAHNDARNIDPNLLPKGVRLIRGWIATPVSMMSGLDDSFDGVLYIGYHSPAGSEANPLSHTMWPRKIRAVRINGRVVSEFSINSLWADYQKVPSIFLSGDDGICQMASEEYPGIQTFAVKTGIGRGTLNMHPADAVCAIRESVEKALKEKHMVRSLPEHFRLEIDFSDHADARNASWYPGAELVDPFCVAFECEDYFEMSVALMFMSEI